MKKIIRWQPELAQSIIYWSLTLIIFFFSLILSLENTGPYWKSNVVMGIFAVFLLLGLRRSFVLEKNSIKIRYAAFWKDKKLTLQQVEKVAPHDHGLELKLTDELEPTIYLLRAKDRVPVRNYFAGTSQEVFVYQSRKDKSKGQSNSSHKQ